MQLLRALRPEQWTKNLVVFAGIVFAAELGDLERWGEAVTIFFAYCAASSAAYLVNDVRDADVDRFHPAKAARAVAAGRVSTRNALVTAAVLAAAALGAALWLEAESAALLAGFLALQAAYTFRLKHVVLLDVLAISGLFVIRAAAGAIAVDVRLSPWLVLCTGLLALFLALAKRRAELTTEQALSTRPSLSSYPLAFVDQLLVMVGAATISAYGLYTFTATPSNAMMLTIPFVLFGLFRYLYLVHYRRGAEEPARILIRDVPIMVTVGLWVATAAIILAIE